MPTPLVDINANPRQPSSRSTLPPSKIPSPPKAQRDRGSPFSVSSAGSPRYTAMSVSSRTTASPKASKIPRKSTPIHVTPSSGSRHGRDNAVQYQNLPSSSGSRRGPVTSLSLDPKPNKPDLLLGRNKPLPSPPFAQIVNPASPLKAQRTLVDADAGSPTEEEWPILKPENISPPKKQLLVPQATVTHQSRSVSDGAAPRKASLSVTVSRKPLPAKAAGAVKPQPSRASNHGLKSDHKRPAQIKEPRTVNPANRYARSFHALSTHDSMTMESPLPLTNKEPWTVLSVPPRVSSKRSSLPLLNDNQYKLATEASSVPMRHVRPGSTKWPILEAIQDDRRLIEVSALSQQQQKTDLENSGDSQHSRPVSGFTQRFAESISTSRMAQSQRGSIDSASTWSTTAGPPLNDKLECEYEGTTRIKRLSWHSSGSETGPVLKISVEADSVLLPHSTSIPEMPSLPGAVSKKSTQERSLSILAGRLSRQTISMVSSGISSRCPTPNTPETVTNRHKSIKISPIRTMQPPRKPSTKPGFRSPHPPASFSSSISDTADKVTSPLLLIDRNVSGASQKTVRPDVNPPAQKLPPLYSGLVGSKNRSETNNNTSSYSSLGSLNNDHTSNTHEDLRLLADRKRLSMPWASAKPTLSMKKSADTNRGSANALPIAARHLDYFEVPPNSSYTAPVGVSDCLPIPSVSKATGGVSPSGGRSKPRHVPSRSRHPPRSTSLSTPSPPQKNSSRYSKDKDAVKKTTPKKVKVKRSLHDMFHKRETKRDKKHVKLPPTRSSHAGSTFAQRFMDSTTFSRISIPGSPGLKLDHEQIVGHVRGEPPGKEGSRDAALSALEAGSSHPARNISPPGLTETAAVINNIVDQVTSMETSSPDRLRGVEIAESVLRSLELYQKARLNADIAKKHARDAESNIERASVELNKLQSLCTPDFNFETLQAIKGLIRSAQLDIPKA